MIVGLVQIILVLNTYMYYLRLVFRTIGAVCIESFEGCMQKYPPSVTRVTLGVLIVSPEL
jgi:hypothetical protein